MQIERIAKICHEANKAFCEGLDDHSQLPWDAAPQWQRDSAINGVRFNLDNPQSPASASHDSWLAEKYADGWVYGPIKDADLKQHPCCVPYEELPIEQQVKDHLFKGIVAAIRPLTAVVTQEAKGCSCDPDKNEVCEKCNLTAVTTIQEISDFIQAFMAERIPAEVSPALRVIIADIMVESIHWGASWQERKALEERKIIIP